MVGKNYSWLAKRCIKGCCPSRRAYLLQGTDREAVLCSCKACCALVMCATLHESIVLCLLCTLVYANNMRDVVVGA
jgi:type IV secretory pathway TrbD component